jgi:hypothetical protein
MYMHIYIPGLDGMDPECDPSQLLHQVHSMCIYLHIHGYICIHIYICMHTHLCMYNYIYVHVYA